MKMPPVPELLAPAGSEESLAAALAAGADAVYFGAKSFSNRMRARNFSDVGLRSAIAKVHDCGAKAYITMNTRIRDREAEEALFLCEIILGGEDPCDAVICADFGLAALIRERYPHAVLHGSTQTSCASAADCEALKKLGFSRLVLPRELSLAEITALARETDLELEMFLHGAHCVSLSGQCLLSYFIGGRSGNRGECAQPCRLPYVKGKEKPSYPLSLADMCLAEHIPAIIDSGVCSLKIEGRLKPPSYVYGVTKIYRTLLDEGRAATKREMSALSDLFTRGFTDGYFTHRYGSMSGGKGKECLTRVEDGLIRGELAGRMRQWEEKKKAALLAEKKPVRALFTMKAGESLSLTLTYGEYSVTALGIVPSPASGKGTDEDTAAKNLTKFGASPFRLDREDLRCTIDKDLWCPLSALNDLRRRATEALSAAMGSAETTEDAPTRISPAERSLDVPKAPLKTAELLDASLLTKATPESCHALLDSFDRLYVPWDRAGEILSLSAGHGCEIAAVLPVLEPSSRRLEQILSLLREQGVPSVMAHTPGQCEQAISHGLAADLSFRANVISEKTARLYAGMGCRLIFASPELGSGTVSALHLGAIVYGKIPAMTLSRCVICLSEKGGCPKGNEGGRHSDPLSAKPHSCRCTLTDRMGARFTVFGQQNCENIVVNAVPTWMGDRLDTLRGASAHHYLFTDESAEAALTVLSRYERGESERGRRI